jgi:hypothetical protein
VSLAAVAALVLAAAGCTAGGPSAVQVDAPAAPAEAAGQCADLLAALPDEVAGQERRDVEPEQATAAAWGDPAILLTCGAVMPDDFEGTSSCQEVNGVGWYVPEEQYDEGNDVVMTTIGRSPVVQVRLPAEYRPPAKAMVDLAGPISQHLTLDHPCL